MRRKLTTSWTTKKDAIKRTIKKQTVITPTTQTTACPTRPSCAQSSHLLAHYVSKRYQIEEIISIQTNLIRIVHPTRKKKETNTYRGSRARLISWRSWTCLAP